MKEYKTPTVDLRPLQLSLSVALDEVSAGQDPGGDIED